MRNTEASGSLANLHPCNLNCFTFSHAKLQCILLRFYVIKLIANVVGHVCSTGEEGTHWGCDASLESQFGADQIWCSYRLLSPSDHCGWDLDCCHEGNLKLITLTVHYNDLICKKIYILSSVPGSYRMPNARGKVGVKSRGNGCSSLRNLKATAKCVFSFSGKKKNSLKRILCFLIY